MTKRILPIFILLPLIVLYSCISSENNKISSLLKFKNIEWVDSVGARVFPNKGKVYNVNDFGAVGDGITMNTEAIQKAINICSENGGGKVVFSNGKYLTGSIYIKSGVNLFIDENITITGSQNIIDYPEIDTRIAGIEMKWPSALINIIGVKNAAITGKGKINAQGKPFWDLYWKMRREVYEPKGLRWVVDYDCKRPRTLLISNCKDISVRNITLAQAGFWTVHILYSSFVTIDGIIIRNNEGGHGPSTDGIDIDSSEKILVQNCDIDCNDDNFCLKSGRDADGLRVNIPTRFVVIKDCISRKGGGLITFGSETSGGISDIVSMNLKAYGTTSGIRLKSAKTRGGTVQNLYFQNLEMDSVGFPFIVNLSWNPKYSYSSLPDGFNYDSIPDHWKVLLKNVEPESKGIPFFKNIYVEGLKSKNAETGINAQGMKVSLLQNFNFENIEITAKKPGTVRYADVWNLKNVNIITDSDKEVKIIESSHVNWIE